MLYRIVRPIAALGLKAFYRKIYLTNTDRIPVGKPVILAANHPTAFLEPCILACFLGRPLHFLVRGDLFQQEFYAGLLRSLHMLPVFRFKDGGYGRIKDNYATFEACYTALHEGKTIMILAEGRTIQEKRLRPLQKGSARIPFGALEAYPDLEEVFIVPVGVNFTYADQPRSEVYIDFGQPILARDYYSEYQENANQAITNVIDLLRERMEQHIIIVEREEDDELVEYLHQLHRTGSPYRVWPIISRKDSPLAMEMEIAGKVNGLSAQPRKQLLEECRAYFRKLDLLGIDDRAVGGKDYATPLNVLILVMAFPLFLPGFLWNYPPVWLGKYISDTRVKTLEFKAPVRWAASLGAYVLYPLLWLIVAAIFGHSGLGLLAILLLLLLGHLALYYLEFRERYRKSRKFGRLTPDQQQQLKEERDAILTFFRQQAVSNS